MTREEKIERLEEYCSEAHCSDCAFKDTDCDFDDWGDNELDDALNKISQPTPVSEEEMRDELYRYCNSRKCEDCIFRSGDGSCIRISGLEGAKLKEKYDMIRENGCDNCKHFDLSGDDDEPCKSCKGTAIGGTPEYESRPHLWEAQTVDVENNTVDHPQHYQGKNECIDVMIAMFGKEAVKHFCMCNAYKYRFRAAMKNGEEDIKKAEWYESKLIELGGVGE